MAFIFTEQTLGKISENSASAMVVTPDPISIAQASQYRKKRNEGINRAFRVTRENQ